MNPTDRPDIFDGLPCHWAGVDDTTPAGCTLFVTTVLGLVTTYVLRGGQVIGRVENDGGRLCGYVGPGLKGGQFVGLGHSSQLAQKIADADWDRGDCVDRTRWYTEADEIMAVIAGKEG